MGTDALPPSRGFRLPGHHSDWIPYEVCCQWGPVPPESLKGLRTDWVPDCPWLLGTSERTINPDGSFPVQPGTRFSMRNASSLMGDA